MPVTLNELKVFQTPQFPVQVQHADGTSVTYGRGRLESAGPDQVLAPVDTVLAIYDEVGTLLRKIPGDKIDEVRDGNPGKVVTVAADIEPDAGPALRTRGSS